LTNESFLIYSHNKTKECFDSLTVVLRIKTMIEESRKEGKELRRTFHNRLNKIQVRRIAAQHKRQKELEEREKKRIKQAENLTNDVCFYGLWQSIQQVKEGIGWLVKDADKTAAIEAQLKFRKTVLQQKHEDRKTMVIMQFMHTIYIRTIKIVTSR
jgi:hypothetical protein